MTENGDNKSGANELETKIIQQIEYYFSDINLSRDKFLKEVIAKESGWVPLQTLLTFNRLKSLSEDKSVVLNALKKSVSNLLEISEDEDKIRRSLEKPLPEFGEKYTQDLNERTLHIKGFPEDTKLDDVINFCKEFGAVENIEMRRFFKSKKFKGCIFVAFVNKEDAQKVLDASDLKYGEKSLLRENKTTYFARKKEYAEKKNAKVEKKETKKDNDEENDEEDNVKEEKEGQESEKKAVNSVKVEGAVMKLKGVGDKTRFTEIKDVFKKYGNVSYVEDVKMNQSLVRFSDKEGAKIALEKIKSEQNNNSDEVKAKSEDNSNSEEVKIKSEENSDSGEVKIKSEENSSDGVKIEIGGNEVLIEVLTGEEEQKYWEDMERNRSENNKKRSQHKRDFNRGKKGKNMWKRGQKRGYQGRGGRDDNKRARSD